ncbi:MAG: hypothetical protein JWM89_1170 [Acidimicrobiales bacterium]|nr:hypothetical protein [Acidimicrobiales bacterium]
MELRPGLRLQSPSSDAQIVVVKATAGVDVDLRCGGHPMVEPDGTTRDEPAGDDGQTLLGKRYAAEELGLEVLCTKGGAGALTIGDVPLGMKSAKPLPSSD